MKTHNNTILITGGGSGIGLETARKFSARGNKDLIFRALITQISNSSTKYIRQTQNK